MASSITAIASSEAPLIASYSIQPPGYPDIEQAQALHRIELVNIWKIRSGSRVLELGCGQGNATAVLAHAVGPEGHVDAVDPGALDYGAPFTLAQAQDYLKQSAVGERISWHQATPEKYLEETRHAGEEAQWDVAILAHCIWYFASPSVLTSILGALRGRARRVCIAEYALSASEKAGVPHVLAVLARGMLESFKGESKQNVRSPLGPRAIKEMAAETGWELTEGERKITPGEGLLDGEWEVGSVKSAAFLREVEVCMEDERSKAIVGTARDAVLNAVEGLGELKVRTMDVWVASFSEKS